MPTLIHLADPDNRDDNGASYEFFGTTDRIIRYIDGPLRRDMRDPNHRLDELIALLRANVHTTAMQLAKHYGIYLTLKQIDGDSIEVVTVGEDGEMWLVTGTTDAWAAEEAVRAHYAYEVGTELDDQALSIEHRTDLKWVIGGRIPSREEDDYLLTGILRGDHFTGFLVSA